MPSPHEFSQLLRTVEGGLRMVFHLAGSILTGFSAIRVALAVATGAIEDGDDQVQATVRHLSSARSQITRHCDALQTQDYSRTHFDSPGVLIRIGRLLSRFVGRGKDPLPPVNTLTDPERLAIKHDHKLVANLTVLLRSLEFRTSSTSLDAQLRRTQLIFANLDDLQRTLENAPEAIYGQRRT
ncbi:hypothetical protein EIP91_008800 [Steccherinum ochraceum]|uniref:Uncharacterized protein n=1 Tax=Steccherinum ochraceum TaxID=92696 RepID=A0A4R0RFN3_9APHY|nr:hypothetical protein EIP91_008800 [Steccherinum ochraceum]